MKNMNKFATALLIAVAVTAPASGAFAAGQPAAPAKPAAAAKMAPATDPSGLVGRWTLADISALDGAKGVKIVDLNKSYGTKDRAKIAAVVKSDKTALSKLHTALNSDAKFKAWAKKNHVSTDRVVGVTNGEIAVF